MQNSHIRLFGINIGFKIILILTTALWVIGAYFVVSNLTIFDLGNPRFEWFGVELTIQEALNPLSDKTMGHGFARVAIPYIFFLIFLTSVLVNMIFGIIKSNKVK